MPITSILEAAFDPLLTVNTTGHITAANEPATKITGVSRQALIGSDFAEYFTDPETVRDYYRRADTQRIDDISLTIRRADGRLIDVVCRMSFHRMADNEVQGAFAIAHDVRLSREAEQQFIAFIKATSDAMLLVDDTGTILLANENCQRLFGYQANELEGKPVDTLIPLRFHGAHVQHLARYFREPRLRPMGLGLDLAGIRKSGTEFPIEVSLSPIEGQKGLSVSVTIRDASAQKQASQYARSLIEASLDPLLTISADGKVTDVNEATIKVTGVARQDLIGTDFSIYFTEPDEARNGYQRVFAEGSVVDYPLTLRHKDGRLIDVLYNASLYRDIRGEVVGVFAAARDVTAQKRAELEIAAQRNRELQRLAELERFQRLTIGRELKMIELKSEIEDLKKQLNVGP